MSSRQPPHAARLPSHDDYEAALAPAANTEEAPDIDHASQGTFADDNGSDPAPPPDADVQQAASAEADPPLGLFFVPVDAQGLLLHPHQVQLRQQPALDAQGGGFIAANYSIVQQAPQQHQLQFYNPGRPDPAHQQLVMMPPSADVAAAIDAAWQAHIAASLRPDPNFSNAYLHGGSYDDPAVFDPNYRDWSCVPEVEVEHLVNDVDFNEKFPVRLIDAIRSGQYFESIAWLSHGRAFVIVDKNRFCAEVMPRLFCTNQYEFFMQLADAYGFRQIEYPGETELIAFYHEKFLRWHPWVAYMMEPVNQTRDAE